MNKKILTSIVLTFTTCFASLTVPDLEITQKIKASDDKELYMRTLYKQMDGYLKIIRQVQCSKKSDGQIKCIVYDDKEIEKYSNTSYCGDLFNEMKHDTIAGSIATIREKN